MTQAPVLVWDFDGTLVEAWQDIATALNRALADADLLTATDERIRSWIGDGLHHLVERALRHQGAATDLTATVIDGFRHHYPLCCTERSRPFAGMRETLSALAAHPMAVASNKPYDLLQPMVAELGLGQHFDLVLGGDSVGVLKPDAAVLTHVAQHFDVAPSSLWMVGDSPVDVAAARAVGARAIGCTWGLDDDSTLRAARPDALVREPGEIVAVVKGAKRGA